MDVDVDRSGTAVDSDWSLSEFPSYLSDVGTIVNFLHIWEP